MTPIETAIARGSRCATCFALVLLCALASGCGKTLMTKGTEQLLASDAIDESIAKLNFSPLAHQKVYLDTDYIKPIKEGIGFVNSDYIISALRQQLVAAHCLLQDKREDAEYIVEARVGAMGTNQHEIVYGIPANNALSTVASVMPNAPPVPSIPEISIARRGDQSATAKVAVFAYHRETREPVWQSGSAVSHSHAKDLWLFGAGPLQTGTIYPETRLAGSRMFSPFRKKRPDEIPRGVNFDKQFLFAAPSSRNSAEPGSSVAGSEPTPAGEAVAAPASEDPVQRAGHSEEPSPAKPGAPPPFPTDAPNSPSPIPQPVNPVSTPPDQFRAAIQQQVSAN